MVTQTILRIVEINGCRMAVKAVSTDSSFHITGAFIAGENVLPLLGVGARAAIQSDICRYIASQSNVFSADDAEMMLTETVGVSA